MYRALRKIPLWKRVPCAGGCGGLGDYWFNGRGLLCRECWDEVALKATAGKAHQRSQRDQEMEAQLQELEQRHPPPMIRNRARVEVRSCSNCGGAVEWIWWDQPTPGGWEGTCVACAYVVSPGLLAAAS